MKAACPECGSSLSDYYKSMEIQFERMRQSLDMQTGEYKKLERQNKIMREALEFARDFESENIGFAGPSIEINEIRMKVRQAIKECDEVKL